MVKFNNNNFKMFIVDKKESVKLIFFPLSHNNF